MDNADPDDKGKEIAEYGLSGKIMLIAIVILFIVIIIMLCLHVYVRRYLVRARNRYSRRPHLVFFVDPALTAASRGLDASVIASLPFFAFSPNTHPDPVECAVCLSELEDGETGRVMPKCKHIFHIECIDMWFQTHSTCPLCRAPVESPPAGQTQPEVSIVVSEPEPECQQGGEEVNRAGPAVSSLSSSSIGKRSERFGYESPSSESSFRSPMSRMMSLKRILSRERKGGCVIGCSSMTMAMADIEAERGGEETQ